MPGSLPETLWLSIALLAGIALGKLLAWLVLRGRIVSAGQAVRAAADVEVAALQERINALELTRSELARELAALREQLALAREAQALSREQLAAESARAARIPELERRVHEQQQAMAAGEQRLSKAQSEIATLETRLAGQQHAAEEKLALLGEARERLTEQFRNLAQEILEDKSRRFTEQNQQNLGQLLDPLRTKIGEFQQKVEQVYDTEGKERAALREGLAQLHALNQQVSKEASDLTRALKGSTKAQGNWGEVLLESLLELAGLVRGQQYEVQEHHQREDGSRAQPDVVIRMPEERRLVIDAKVSLLSYEQYASAEDDAGREAALARHLESIRNHVKGLAARDYQELHGGDSPDFVLMFIALEPAFMTAVTQDHGLFQYAWERNVLLVSPSTLLFVLRTVAQLWRSDAQNRNALAIAKEGAELYDKLVGVVEALEKIGERVRQAEDELANARTRLSGKGGALRRAEQLRKLGIKPKKSMPAATRALLEDDLAPGAEESAGSDDAEDPDAAEAAEPAQEQR